MTAAGLKQVIDGAPLVVCVGPGGVGKTTLSAVLALHQAATGARSLVLTIDPARRLADALDVPGLTNDPVAISSFGKMHPGGTLSALMLDPSATFDHLIALLVADPDRRRALLENRTYQYVSRYLAGTLEYMAVERLHALTQGGAYDRIVLDTPPTSNAIDFLEAPDRLATFFSDQVISRFMPKQQTSWTSRLLNRASSSVLSLLNRVAGDTFVEDVVNFVSTFGDLFGQFRERGIAVGKTLRDPRTAFVIVCAPDQNRLAEARSIDERLQQAGCRAHAFIVNRVDAPFLSTPGDDALARATVLLGGAAERPRVQAFIERLEQLRRSYDSSAATHAQAVESLRAYAAPRPVFTAPRVPPGESPRAALLALYLGLFADTTDTTDATAAGAPPPLPPDDGARRSIFGRRRTDRP
ncbi:MAG: ArsA family ATPase [Deltaproteobacteria bacterium]|nr:ArsA family ATPase [Deltaproteobacteria bacterium]